MTDKEKELYIKYCKYDKDPKEIILNLVGLIEKKDKIIDRMAKTMIEIQFEEKYCEFIRSDDERCLKVDKECSECVREYFEKKEEERNEKRWPLK